MIRESSILVITEIEGFRTTPRHSPCLSVKQGADFLTAKPALPYLDIVRDVREYSSSPVVAYTLAERTLYSKPPLGRLARIRSRGNGVTSSIERAGADGIVTLRCRAGRRATGLPPASQAFRGR
ncbi:hypothetical protein [Halobellus rarus]|uniref:porphobilinogen synthase n=1 Tax=Halobellus rarus TaxID=1126237 RepID=A0ABD6CQ58_9EURY